MIVVTKNTTSIVKPYRKKPITVHAAIWDGEDDTALYILDWADGAATWRGHFIDIKSPSGTMTAGIGDFIVRIGDDNFYVCTPDVFAASYDAL